MHPAFRVAQIQYLRTQYTQLWYKLLVSCVFYNMWDAVSFMYVCVAVFQSKAIWSICT